MPFYCKNCGYIFGEGKIPKLVQKNTCPTCKNKLYETKEDISYFQGRIEKSNPTWEDVLRSKYLKNIVVNKQLSNINIENERKRYKEELEKLKNNQPSVVTSSKPTVICPYCQSANTKKISATSKAGSVALFGIFAMGKVSKQWHCNDCKSDF